MNGLGTRLENCYSGAVFDVLRERGIDHTLLPRDIVALDRRHVLAGPVFTVRGSPKSNLSADESLVAWTEFLSRAPRGSVVVIEGRDEDRALMGELSAETLQFRGVKGLVTDGGCRDCAFIERIGFPVFSRFRTPRDVVGAWSPDEFNAPIRIGSVEVSPGDYILADIDGAIVIPLSIITEVVDEVEKVMNTESMVRKAILDGMDPKEAYLRHGRF